MRRRQINLLMLVVMALHGAGIGSSLHMLLEHVHTGAGNGCHHRAPDSPSCPSGGFALTSDHGAQGVAHSIHNPAACVVCQLIANAKSAASCSDDLDSLQPVANAPSARTISTAHSHDLSAFGPRAPPAAFS